MAKVNFSGIAGAYPSFFGINIAKIDKFGPAYLKSGVDSRCVDLILVGTYFERKAKTMTRDVDAAIVKVEQVTAEFSTTLDKFIALEDRFVEQSKRAAGNVRDSYEKLSQGLAKVEKAANFDRLEKYVEYLERAASAMTTLAELEASGKLDKIAAAIR